MPKIVLPGQNVAIQTPQSQIEPLWYEKLKGWEAFINLASNYIPPASIVSPPLTASLGADVATNVLGNYFQGPSIAQGTVGTWFVSGSVTIVDTAGASTFWAKLWDGTTVIASGAATTQGANGAAVIALSGYLASPVNNLRISVREPNLTTGSIKFNVSGNSKDSTISAFRIA
jgi:hypothetical protein